MLVSRWSSALTAAVCLATLGSTMSPARAQTLPGVPRQFEAQVLQNQVRFTWNAAGGAVTSYRIEAGSAPGAANLAAIDVAGSQLSFNVSAPAGAYFVRVRAVNGAAAGEPSNEVHLMVGSCPSPPPAPAALLATVSGTAATLAWPATPLASSYTVEAGTSLLSGDLLTGDVGASLTMSAVVGPGIYFVRVRARNACGTSPPSPEAQLVIVGGAAPGHLVAGVVGSNVTLAWAAPAVAVPGGYLLGVGTAPGASDVGTIPIAGSVTRLTASGVAPGTYYVRVRAVTAGSPGAPSNEAVVIVPPAEGAPHVVGFSVPSTTVPLLRYEEAGISVVPAVGEWELRTTYGVPPPYAGFTRVGSNNSLAALAVSADGVPFRVPSLQVYSSVTTIPVVLTGMLGPHVVYSVNATLPNTLGTFAGIENPFAGAVVDRLLIAMSNTWAGNPMGIDNLVVIRN